MTEALEAYLESLCRSDRLLGTHLEAASILWYGSSALVDWYDPALPRDVLVLLPDSHHERFQANFGSRFVIDDHDAVPPVFLRVRHRAFLEHDLLARPSVANWLYQHGVVLRDPDRAVHATLLAGLAAFRRQAPEILRRKYLEFRTDRHGLRTSFAADDRLGVVFVKAHVIRLGLEILFLAEMKPYPYKKLLVWAAERETRTGTAVLVLAERLWNAQGVPAVIEASDSYVGAVNDAVRFTGALPEELLEYWWLNLD